MPLRHKTVGGDYLVTADCCGRVRYYSQVRTGTSTRQRGFLICPEHFDEDQPLDRTQDLGQEPRVEGPITGPPRQTWRVRDDTPPDPNDPDYLS